MRNLKGRATVAALGLVPAVVLATAGSVTAGAGVDPFYADGHKHASYADYSTTAKAPTTRVSGTPPDLFDAKGKPLSPAAIHKRHGQTAPHRPATGQPRVPRIEARLLAGGGGPTSTARTAATTLTTYTHSCVNNVPYRFAGPPPPAAGNPFGVARAARNPISGTWQGWLQGEVTKPGLGAAATSPLAWTEYDVDVWNDNIPNLTVKASIVPKWHGAMQLRSSFYDLTFSSASGTFNAWHGWFNRTLNRWDGFTDIRIQNRTSQLGTENYYAFDRPMDSTETIGTTLPKGQTVTYSDRFETQVSVQTQPGAPAAAVTDFGSAGLDTPASMIDRTTGQPLRGWYDAGTKPISGTIKTTFSSPTADFNLTCLG